MLDHIKHSIVSLQIAKNMANPINGIYNGPVVGTSTKLLTESGTSESSIAIDPIDASVDSIAILKAPVMMRDDDDSTAENGNYSNFEKKNSFF